MLRFAFPVIMLLAFASRTAQAQEEPCLALLRDGLYRHVFTERTENYARDLKSYFSSQAFRQDFRDKRFSGGVGLVIDAVPVELDLNASDERISQFTEQVRSAREVTVSRASADRLVSAIPDPDLARAYVECGERLSPFGFKTNIAEYDNVVVVSVQYRKQLSSDPLPRVRSFFVDGAISADGTLSAGDTVPEHYQVTVRRYPENDVIVAISTDRGSVNRRIAGRRTGFDKEMPVGSIIASVLDFNSFSQITDERPSSAWDAGRSKWAPADGRSVAASLYARKSGQSSVPDLRGVFLRGLNVFDPGFGSAVTVDRKDPEDGRSVGSFQRDALQDHQHALGKGVSDKRADSQPDRERFADFVNSPPGSRGAHKSQGVDQSARSAIETRPKNVALYFYVKIN